MVRKFCLSTWQKLLKLRNCFWKCGIGKKGMSTTPFAKTTKISMSHDIHSHRGSFKRFNMFQNISSLGTKGIALRSSEKALKVEMGLSGKKYGCVPWCKTEVHCRFPKFLRKLFHQRNCYIGQKMTAYKRVGPCWTLKMLLVQSKMIKLFSCKLVQTIFYSYSITDFE